MQTLKLSLSLLLLCLFIPASWSKTNSTNFMDGHSHIFVKESIVQGIPKSTSIQATIDGHYLSVVFLESLGQVTVEVTQLSGGETQIESTPTPNGVNFYISSTGSYRVTFTLSNGDEYYGEFEVTD